MKNLEKLNQLLEQEQCEFVGIEDGFTGSTADGCLRLIYLMNDCVESFLVLKNARMTGNYRKGYEGELEASLERQGKDYVLVVHQGESLRFCGISMIILGRSFAIRRRGSWLHCGIFRR